MKLYSSLLFFLALSCSLLSYSEKSSKVSHTFSAEQSRTLVYSAPKEILPSTDFTAKVNGKNAYVFYSAGNDYRDDFVPGGMNPWKTKYITRDSWISLESVGIPEVTVKRKNSDNPISEVYLVNDLGNEVKHTVNNVENSVSFNVVPGRKYYLAINREYDVRFLLFAEKPEKDAPDPDAADTLVISPGTNRQEYENSNRKILYFAPGLHDP